MPLECKPDQNQFLESEYYHFNSGVQKNPCVITVSFLNTWSNEWTEEFFSFREGFDRYGSQKKAGIFVLIMFQN